MVMPINHLPGGKKLPALSNPATAEQIFAGYEAINQAGEIMMGTASEGMKEASGSFTSPSTGGQVTINVGFKPKYIVMQWRFTYIGDPAYGQLFCEASRISSGYVLVVTTEANSGFRYYADSFIKSVTENGFNFRSYLDHAANKTINYWVFGN